MNPITISFWIKYFGLVASPPPSNTYIPIFYFCSTTSYFGYFNNTFVLVINSVLAYQSNVITNYIGVWTIIGISAHRSSNTILFPNMFNFMVQTSILVPLPAFNVYSTQVNFDNLSFSQNTVSLFSSLNVNNNFIFGIYGIAMGVNLLTINQIQIFSLSGSTSSNCVSTTQLKSGNIGSLGINCVADYNPYSTPSLNCNNNNNYFDLSITDSIMPCAACDSSCVTTCFGSNSQKCSCFYNSLDSWITTQSPVSNYYCYGIIIFN